MLLFGIIKAVWGLFVCVGFLVVVLVFFNVGLLVFVGVVLVVFFFPSLESVLTGLFCAEIQG